MNYFYELHAHSVTSSLCGRVKPEDLVSFYQSRGYAGMVLTDHFYHGNTAISRRLPWQAFAGAFCRAYYRLKKEADRVGFRVFFGLEHRFADGMDEYLVLGITPQWVGAHPELRDLPRKEFCDLVRRAGGFVIQAHPYRDRDYIRNITLSGEAVDAIEVYNVNNPMDVCRQAMEYAQNLGLPMVGGSDLHSVTQKVLSGVALPEPAHTVQDLIEGIRSGKAKMLPLGIEEELKQTPLTDPKLPVRVLTNGKLQKTQDFFSQNR